MSCRGQTSDTLRLLPRIPSPCIPTPRLYAEFDIRRGSAIHPAHLRHGAQLPFPRVSSVDAPYRSSPWRPTTVHSERRELFPFRRGCSCALCVAYSPFPLVPLDRLDLQYLLDDTSGHARFVPPVLAPTPETLPSALPLLSVPQLHVTVVEREYFLSQKPS